MGQPGEKFPETHQNRRDIASCDDERDSDNNHQYAATDSQGQGFTEYDHTEKYCRQGFQCP